MNRTEFQQLAGVRVKEAEALLAAGLWDGAYYLAGYAVECGLKACIANLFKAETFPEKAFSEKCYVHDLEKLVILAGLKQLRNDAVAADPAFAQNWDVVKDWSEQSRYKRVPEPTARNLLQAVTDPTNGVLQWIAKYW